MANIKELSKTPTASQPVATEAEAAKLALKLETQHMLLTESAKQMEETRERLEEKREAREEELEEEAAGRKSLDTAQLSRQSKWFGVEGKHMVNAHEKWVLEMEKELWEALLMWTPVSGEDLAKQLGQLSRLYLALLESVLIHTMGEEQNVQTGRLDTVLAQKLNLLLDKSLEDLERFLEQNGQTKGLGAIKAALYKRTAGKTISPREAEAFFARGKSHGAGKAGAAGRAGSGVGAGLRTSSGGRTTEGTRAADGDRAAANSRRSVGNRIAAGNGAVAGGRTATGSQAERSQRGAMTEEGMIYRRSKGGNIQVNQGFQAQKRAQEQLAGRRNTALESGKGSLTGKSLTEANRFAEHLNGRGNLFKNPGITAQNEELQGLLSAVTYMKGQVYASASNREAALVTPFKSAINQMVDAYLSKKGAFDVYYYTIGIYERTKNPQKAMEEGSAYAYKQFLARKGQGALGVQPAYSQQAGFFRMLKDQNMEADLKRGMRILEENWRDFLLTMGEGRNKGVSQAMQRQSLWGSLMGPGGSKKSSRGKLFFAGVAGLCVLAVFYMCFRLFM